MMRCTLSLGKDFDFLQTPTRSTLEGREEFGTYEVQEMTEGDHGGLAGLWFGGVGWGGVGGDLPPRQWLSPCACGCAS